MEEVDATESGVKVRHAQNPSKVGETTGEVRFRAGRDVATIRLANGELAYIPSINWRVCRATKAAFKHLRRDAPEGR
jgi:hypothetical protein